MKDQRYRTNRGATNIANTYGFGTSARPIVTVDVERYQAWFDASDLSPVQKEEFAQSLWFIVITFVELGFGVHPLQRVYGQNAADGAVEADTAFHAVKSKKSDHGGQATCSSPVGALEVE